jgi:hypothetical protein
MIFYRLSFISILFFLVSSCIGTVEKPDKKGLIPQKKLMPILTEIQLVNGLVSSYMVQERVELIDTTTTYHYITEKYGYTKEALDKTLHYYFLKKPRRLVKMYEKALAKLSEMEAFLENQIKIETDKKANVWLGEKNYYYPVSRCCLICVVFLTHKIMKTIEDLDSENPEFQISLFGSDSYLLKFTATLFPDDQSIDAKARLYVVRADSALTGKRIYFETPKYIKDGVPHEYEIKILIAQYRNMILKGSLYDVTTNVNEQQRHINLENIGLRNLNKRL